MTDVRSRPTLFPVLVVALGLLAAPLPATAQEAPAAAEARSQTDGITVHGHWVLEIVNADGTVDRRVEVENSLQLPGALALANLLAGYESGGSWQVAFGTNTGPCGSDPCYITEAGSEYVSFHPDASTDLTVAVDSTNNATVLSGSNTASVDGTIEFVNTSMGTCAATVPPESCDLDTGHVFSQKALDTPVSVSASQTVNVSVTFTFN